MQQAAANQITRRDPKTGAIYRLHFPQSKEPQKESVLSERWNSYEEFQQRDIDYMPEEIRDFERVSTSLQHRESLQVNRQVSISNSNQNNNLQKHRISKGIFAGLGMKMITLLRHNDSVREIIAILGHFKMAKIVMDVAKNDMILAESGCFFQNATHLGDSRHYALMKDPPTQFIKSIEEEDFDTDKETLIGLLQDRLRIELSTTQNSFHFYFV